MCSAMKTYIAFLQSVSGNEWFDAESVCWDINTDPENIECKSEVFYIKSYNELKDMLSYIVEKHDGDNIIIQIGAHSNIQGISFKDINNSDKEQYSDFASWSKVRDLVCNIYNNYSNVILLVFVSCLSAEFVKSLESHHMPIIAAEGKVDPRRASEQLLMIYQKVCKGVDLEDAYNTMLQKYPFEGKICREENERSILKLFI